MTIFEGHAPWVASVIAGLVVLGLWRRQRAAPLPPGPKPLPLIDNLLDLPREKEWLTYRAWNDEYGDVVCVDILGQKIVILGSATAVNDLLEQRGAIYSDRPVTPMSQLMKLEWAFSLLPYGELWRRKRKLLHTHVHQGVVDRYHPVQVASARRFVKDILAGSTSDEALHQAIRLNFAQTIIKMAYGLDVDSYDSPYVALPEEVMQNFNEAFVPGRFLVDVVPILKYVPSWLPGAGFKRMAAKHRITQRLALDNPMRVVQSQMAAGTAPPSMAQSMLKEDAMMPPHKSQLDMIGDIAGIVYIVGSDTTGSAVLAFFLAMLVYPDVQIRAQAEIDRVVGKGRLPKHADRKDLPYVGAVVNECLRWLPVLPMVPHRNVQDDHYRGYLIPKGTIVLASVWGILHNATDYPEPERFHPERYLTPDGQLDPSVRDPRTACFGFGRRLCPGRFIADANVFITIATLLATVDIVRAKDAQGREIVPDVDVTSGVVSHAKPFPWAVQPRRPGVEGLLSDQ